MKDILLMSIHPGALEWMRLQGFEPSLTWLAHQVSPKQNPFSPSSRYQPSGYQLFGSVPVHVAARFGEYLDIVMDLPADALGKPLSLAEMLQFNARLGEYHVEQVWVDEEPRAILYGEALELYKARQMEREHHRLDNTIPCTVISQHPGAAHWLEEYNYGFPQDACLHVDRVYDHIPPDFPHLIRAGEMVVGTLPVHLAAWVCHRGARYADMMVEMPPKALGRRFDGRYLERTLCYLDEFTVNWVLPAEEPLFTR